MNILSVVERFLLYDFSKQIFISNLSKSWSLEIKDLKYIDSKKNYWINVLYTSSSRMQESSETQILDQ